MPPIRTDFAITSDSVAGHVAGPVDTHEPKSDRRRVPKQFRFRYAARMWRLVDAPASRADLETVGRSGAE
jgi:hypothetical protein